MPGINLVDPSTGVSAKVNHEGKVQTLSTTLPVAATINAKSGMSFTITDTITPAPSADFFWMKNVSDKPLVLVASEFWSDTDAKIMLYRNPTGTPTGGLEISPANCNFGSNQQAPGTFYYGEDLGGMSEGLLRNIIRLQPNVSRRYRFDDWTILTRNTTFRMYIENSGGELDFWLQIFFLHEEFS